MNPLQSMRCQKCGGWMPINPGDTDQEIAQATLNGYPIFFTCSRCCTDETEYVFLEGDSE